MASASRLTNHSLQSLALLLVATLFPVHLLALDRAVTHLRSRKRGWQCGGARQCELRQRQCRKRRIPPPRYEYVWGPGAVQYCNPCSPACTHRTASCRPFRNLGVYSTRTFFRCVLHRPHRHHHEHRSSPLLAPSLSEGPGFKKNQDSGISTQVKSSFDTVLHDGKPTNERACTLPPLRRGGADPCTHPLLTHET
jgi:hypothetical protein